MKASVRWYPAENCWIAESGSLMELRAGALFVCWHQAIRWALGYQAEVFNFLTEQQAYKC